MLNQVAGVAASPIQIIYSMKEEEKNLGGTLGEGEASKKIEDQYYWGIQKFNTAKEAFNVMDGAWGENEVDGETHLEVLTDTTFETIIKARAFRILCLHKLGKISKDKLDSSLCRADDINDHLLDFNFLLYSEKSKSYYTSRMEFKDDFVYRWSKRQWKIFDELRHLYLFDALVNEAERIFNIYSSEIVDEDVIDEIIFNDLGWRG